jgi:hypothetical protein
MVIVVMVICEILFMVEAALLKYIFSDTTYILIQIIMNSSQT